MKGKVRVLFITILELERGGPFGNLTVRDVVDNLTKSKNQWGIEGYDIPKYNPHFDKSFTVKISNIKKTSYLDDVMRKSKFIPAPWQYKIKDDGLIDPKKKSPLSKMQKMTYLDLIEKEQKKKNIPGPGTYQSKSRDKVLGAIDL